MKFSREDIVYDDLTGKVVRIVDFDNANPLDRGDNVIFRKETYFVVVDDDFLNGLRWPWEITPYVND